MKNQEHSSTHPRIKSPLILSLKGMAMGVAEVIPGVSGGTIAFITGIYERLLLAIRGFDTVFFRLLLRGKLKDAWYRIDTKFILFLFAGMACGVVVGVFGVTHLMEKYPEPLWAFFFGLIVASAWYVGRQVQKWDLVCVIALIGGIGIAYTITVVSPAEGSTNLLYVAMSGMLAICALMLPGISGSFVLLLLGMYGVIIGSLKEILMGQGMDKIVLLLCFITGMVIGVMAFARVLTWMFKRHHMTTLALLSGFMIGSLPKIWPWRMPTKWMDDTGNTLTTGTPDAHAQILTEKAVLPGDYFIGDPHTILAIIGFLAGFCIIIFATYFEKRFGAHQHMA